MPSSAATSSIFIFFELPHKTFSRHADSRGLKHCHVMRILVVSHNVNELYQPSQACMNFRSTYVCLMNNILMVTAK